MVVPGSPADVAGVRPGDVIVRIDDRPGAIATSPDFVNGLKPGDTVQLQVRRGDRQRDIAVVVGRRPAGFATGFAMPIHLHGDSIQHAVRVYMDSIRVRVDSVRLDQRHIEEIVRSIERAQTQLAREQPWVVTLPGTGAPEVMVFRTDSASRLQIITGTGSRSALGAEFAELNPGLAEYFGVGAGLLVVQVAPDTPGHRAGLRAGDVIVAVGGRRVTSLADLRQLLPPRGGSARLDIIRKRERHSLDLRL